MHLPRVFTSDSAYPTGGTKESMKFVVHAQSVETGGTRITKFVSRVLRAAEFRRDVLAAKGDPRWPCLFWVAAIDDDADADKWVESAAVRAQLREGGLKDQTMAACGSPPAAFWRMSGSWAAAKSERRARWGIGTQYEIYSGPTMGRTRQPERLSTNNCCFLFALMIH